MNSSFLKSKISYFIFFIFSFQGICQTTITFDDLLIDDVGLSTSYTSEGFTFSINATNGRVIQAKTTLGFQNSPTLYDNNADVGGITQWSIKKEDGDVFNFESIFLEDAGEGGSISGTIQGYLNNNPVGSSLPINFNSSTSGLKDFSSNPDFKNIDEIRINADDINVYLDHFSFTVPGAPIATAPSVPIVNEDESNVALADDIQIADEDGDDQTVTFTITGGTLSLGTSGITFGGSGNGFANFTATGTLANINAALDAATFTPSPNLYGSNAATISFVSNDGTSDSNTALVTFDIQGINDDPTFVGLPGSVIIEEDADPGYLSNALSDAIFADIDAGTNDVSLTIAASQGTFNIVVDPSTYGVSQTGVGTNTLVLTGTATGIEGLLDINTNIGYFPPANLSGVNAAVLTLKANDNGNTGSGGGTDVDLGSINVNISPVNDAPEISLPGSISVTEDVSTALMGISFSDVDAESESVTVGMSIGAGVFTTSSGGGVTVSGEGTSTLTLTGTLSDINIFIAGSNLTYQNASGNTADQTLAVSISDNGNTGSGGSLTDNATTTIMVNPKPALVTSVSVPANGTYPAMQNMDFNVNFDENVVVDVSGGVPSLSITIGSSTRYANYISGSGSSSLVYRYITQLGDQDTDGITVGALIANGGTIQYNNIDANLTLQNIGSTSDILVDTINPTGYSVSIDQAQINASNASAVSFTFAGAEVGTDYEYYFSSSGGGTNIYGSGAIVTATDQVSGIDLSGLSDGIITLSVFLTDGADNAGPAANDTADKDVITPSGYSVSIDQGQINASNESAVSFTFAGAEVGSTYNYTFTSSSGGTPVTGSGTIITATDQISGIDLSGLSDGIITLSVTLTDGAGNSGTSVVDTSIKSMPITLDITVDAGQSKAYGEADPVFTYTVTGFESGDDESILSGGLSRVAGEEVGAYVIQLGTLSAGSNYVINFIGSDFNITPATLDITVDAGSNKTYGELDPELTYTVTGFESGDDESILSGALSRESGEEVGIYAIEQGTLSAGSNYNINFTSADFNISPATIDITVDAGQSKVYGGADPVFTYTVTGFESGDDESILSGALSREAGEEVGTYAIEQGTLSCGSNYNLNFTSADFNISPATLDITVDAGQSKTYGEADPEFTYMVTGFESGDDESILSGALSRVAGEEVGVYAIQLGTLSGGSNYNINLTSADFAVESAILNITADANSKVYGEPDPEFTYQASGFVNGDDLAIVTGALSRTAGEDAGNYPITLGSLSAGTNYDFHFETADFEIVKTTQEIVWNQGLSFGCGSDSQLSLTASTSSGLPVTYTVTNTSIAEVIGAVLTQKQSGTTLVVAQQPGDENHHPATSVEKEILISQGGLIRQHWDDVLVFDNSGGGFVSYQWYKNGAPIPGATKQYYSESEVLSGSYYIKATTESGEVITSCPLELTGESITKKVSVVPNPVSAASEFVLGCNYEEAALGGASITIIDLNGRILQTVPATGTETRLTAPTQTGIYVISLSLSGGERKTVNLLVK